MSNIKLEDIVEEQEFDLKYWFFRTLKYWYLFVLIIGMFLAGGYVYLRYKKTIYDVRTTILLVDQRKGSTGDIDVSMLGGLGYNSLNQRADITNEIAIITSFDMIQRTLDSLNFQVSYHTEGTIKSGEIYGTAVPIEVKINEDNPRSTSLVHLEFDGTDRYKAVLKYSDDSRAEQECKFGELCENEYYSFTTTIKDSAKLLNFKKPLHFRVHDLEKLTVRYIGRTKAGSSENDKRFGRFSSIIELSMSGHLKEKNIDFLNTLSKIYIKKQLDEKNKVATNTIQFIDEQLNSIADSLSWVESTLEGFRATKGIVDLSSQGQMLQQSLLEAKTQRDFILLNQKYYNYLSNYLDEATKGNNLIIAPSTASINDPTLVGLINQLNEAISRKIKLTQTEGEESPLYKGFVEQYESIKNRLKENVKNLKATSEISLQQADKKLALVKAQISTLPRNEQKLLNIKRKFNLNNELYTFLLKKKKESEITKAANTPNSKVLNKARSVQAVVIAPFPKRIYITVTALGFILVLAILVLKFYLSNTITDLHQIKRYKKTPILASIPHANNESGALVLDAPKSSFAEAFRNIRINLDFVTVDKKCKVIGVTSTISGEGKTFCAINLAHILALADKKTLLIGLDLRKPKLHSELGISKEVGLTNYLIGAVDLEGCIQKASLETLDIITSGPLPPNPTELIENGRLEDLLAEAEDKYDYVIVDGPPIGLVTDYIAAAQLMDTTLFIVRMNYSRTHSIDLLTNYIDKGILKSSYLLINDITVNSRAYEYSYSYTYGYGYSYGGYGYLGYTDDSLTAKPPFWKRLFQKTEGKKKKKKKNTTV